MSDTLVQEMFLTFDQYFVEVLHCIFILYHTEYGSLGDVPVFVVAPEIVVWQKKNPHLFYS